MTTHVDNERRVELEQYEGTLVSVTGVFRRTGVNDSVLMDEVRVNDEYQYEHTWVQFGRNIIKNVPAPGSPVKFLARVKSYLGQAVGSPSEVSRKWGLYHPSEVVVEKTYLPVALPSAPPVVPPPAPPVVSTSKPDKETMKRLKKVVAESGLQPFRAYTEIKEIVDKLGFATTLEMAEVFADE